MFGDNKGNFYCCAEDMIALVRISVLMFECQLVRFMFHVVKIIEKEWLKNNFVSKYAEVL